MWVNEFEFEEVGANSVIFYEPLKTTAPQEAQPYCCYIDTVIFLKEPREVDDSGNYARWDQIKTQWNMLGERWTDADLGWRALSPLVEHAGEIYDLSGGTIRWRDGQWFLAWRAYRLPEDDVRVQAMRQRGHALLDELVADATSTAKAA